MCRYSKSYLYEMILYSIQSVLLHQMFPPESPVLVLVVWGKWKCCLLQFPVSHDVSRTKTDITTADLIPHISNMGVTTLTLLFESLIKSPSFPKWFEFSHAILIKFISANYWIPPVKFSYLLQFGKQAATKHLRFISVFKRFMCTVVKKGWEW